MAAGSNAVKWEKRYTQNSTYSGTSDCMQALYLGVNYYIFECNPNMAKIMAGIEYAHSNGTDASRQKGFTGWRPENIFPHRAAVIIRADKQHRPRVRIRPQRRQHILLRQIAVPVRRAANRHPLHPHSAQHAGVHRR